MDELRKREHVGGEGEERREESPIVQYPRLELKLFVSLPDAGMPIAGVPRAMFLRTMIRGVALVLVYPTNVHMHQYVV